MRRPSECLSLTRVAKSAAQNLELCVISLSSVSSGRCACDWYVEPGSSFTHPRNISFEMTAAHVQSPLLDGVYLVIVCCV